MTTRCYALLDAQWQRIEYLLPGRLGTVGLLLRTNPALSSLCSSAKRFGDFLSNSHSPHATLSGPQLFLAFLKKTVLTSPFKKHRGFEAKILYVYDREVFC